MTITIQGDVTPGFEPIADAFAAAFDGHPSMGAALAIRIKGERVVNLFGGIADERTSARWEPETASVVFSCTKGLVSILAARLVQEGRLDYEAPVARYWPEFAAAGKGDVQVKHLLAHKAGLSAPIVDVSPDDMLDWPTMATLLAAQAPLWPLGSGHAYHALTHGWLAGEVIRRVTGQSVGAFFAETIAGPLAVPAWIGLPEDAQEHVAHLQVDPALLDLWAAEAAKTTTATPNWTYRAMTLGKALPASLVTADGGFNDPRIRSAEIPGAGGIATADALASIWSATVTETDGVRLLAPATAALATTVQSEGPPVFAEPPPHPRWGMGFQLDSDARHYLTPQSFGHDGAGGQVTFADPAAELGFAFVTNWMMGPGDLRATRIIDALRAAL
ncbi:CubicO group peptidase, beta-lactamase class C family [Kaistia soli DSM 19436]|uniref:CubicO group peptidase, beta-lactamase class C family n=1 Tax=Kaistia soli DSM 19436 TaxID=1122133 RepID=A0A1M5E3F2_9HYPH|nr:serine hydrolase domain-containing protein [Kaistia soli]SHF73767.1 CubicO group peptidase, beta-lactamase class C family [Kaistia soli DSM 19436]